MKKSEMDNKIKNVLLESYGIKKQEKKKLVTESLYTRFFKDAIKMRQNDEAGGLFGVTVLAYLAFSIANKLYKKTATDELKKCSGLKGDEKEICKIIVRIKAKKKKINNLKESISLKNQAVNPDVYVSIVKKEIDKIEEDIKKLNNRLKELRESHTVIVGQSINENNIPSSIISFIKSNKIDDLLKKREILTKTGAITGAGLTIVIVKACFALIRKMTDVNGESKKCDMFEGKEKTKCKLVIKIKAYNAATKKAKEGLVLCNKLEKEEDKTKCIEKTKFLVKKYEQKVKELEEDLKNI